MRASFTAGPKAFADGVEALAPDGTPEHRADSLVRLSTMVGALALARAGEDDPNSDEIVTAVKEALAER